MKLIQLTSLVILFTIGFVGCYTVLTHPTIEKDGYSQRVRFYNDCLSCHSNSELIDFGYEYLNKYPNTVVVEPLPVWVSPSISPPWWVGIKLPIEDNPPPFRSNDETRLRNTDGGRSSAPTDFSIPSRNTSSSGNSNSSNSSNSNTTNSSNERNSKDSNATKSRDNSGERKK